MLDQGAEGACVGFAWCGELMASPKPIRFDDADDFARTIYREAQHVDEWPGENYEGTSVLAGAKVIQASGLIGEYRWAFGVDDVIDTLCAPYADGGGPVVIGIPWLDGMYETRPSGLVDVSGSIVGGHALTLIGYHPNMLIRGEPGRHEVVKWRNSWGSIYGRRGTGYVRVDDLERLLASAYGAEACVPLARRGRPLQP